MRTSPTAPRPETSQLNATAKLLEQQTDDMLAKLQETDQKIANLQSEAQAAAGPTRTAATTPEILLLLGVRPTLQSRYDSFFQRFQDTRLQIEMRSKTTERLSTADLPINPVSPRPKQRLVLGAIAGLVLGLGAAALREQLDARLRNRKQLEEVMGLTVLAELPFDQGVKANSRLAPSDSTVREAARLLRTGIELIGITEPVKRIMITSAQPGDGKTTVTAELAAAFARLGRRVVIVSADLRRSKLERRLGVMSLRPGVSDFINSVAELGLEGASNLDINDYIRPTIEENLFIVPLGAPAHNPSELLASPGFVLLLDALEGPFDVILVDTPPILAVADASIVSQHVNAVLPVVSLLDSGRETLSRFKDALKSLPAQPLGLVMNKTSKAARYDYASAYRDRDGDSPGAPSGGFGAPVGFGQGFGKSAGLYEPVAIQRSRIRSAFRRIVYKPVRPAR